MLADELVAHKAPGAGVDISSKLPLIKSAPRFVLGPDISAVAENLAEDYAGLARVFDRCRLPYPQMWIEVAQADRPKFMAAGMQAPAFQLRPKRVGFLLEATRADCSAWKTHLFWNHETMGNSCAHLQLLVDMREPFPRRVGQPIVSAEPASPYVKYGPDHPGWKHAPPDVKRIMFDHTDTVIPDWGPPIVVGLPPDKLEEFARLQFDLARSDWAGEAAFLLALIGLMNARNTVEIGETVEHAKLNKARAKKRQLPLLSYRVVKIADRQVRRVPGDPRTDKYAPMRGHFVRGHFKVRKSGIFFWVSHTRGDFSRGYVQKDYELK